MAELLVFLGNPLVKGKQVRVSLFSPVLPQGKKEKWNGA